MNCPVCKSELPFDLKGLEDFYYDCPVCHSSLSFHKGGCEVISRGQWPQASSPKGQTLFEAEGRSSREGESTNQASIEGSDSGPAGEDPSHREWPSGEQNLDQNILKSGDQAGAKQEDPSSLKSSQDQNKEAQNMREPTAVEPYGAPEEGQISPAQDNKALVQEDQASSAGPASFDEPSASLEEVTEVPEIGEEEPSEFMEQGAEGSSAEEDFAFQEEEEEPAKEDFSEVIEFSKDKKRQEKGLYLYRLFLSEINSQNLKDKVISVLEDASLELDFQEQSSYREEIFNKGKIVLAKLSPIQTYIILHHLMGLPLKAHWEQSHIADS